MTLEDNFFAGHVSPPGSKASKQNQSKMGMGSPDPNSSSLAKTVIGLEENSKVLIKRQRTATPGNRTVELKSIDYTRPMTAATTAISDSYNGGFFNTQMSFRKQIDD